MSLSTRHRGTVAVLLCGLALAGCAAGRPAGTISHPAAGGHLLARHHRLASIPVPAGQGSVRALIARLQAHAATPFEAKYLFGAGPVQAVIFYAVRPPGGLYFSQAPMIGSGPRTRIVANGSAEYRCVQRGTGQARWTCQQLTKASAAAQNKIISSYTAAHWATYLKKIVRAGATKVRTFTMRPDAPPTIGKRALAGWMSCIGFRAASSGPSTICAAAPGILGSVMLCRGPIFPMEWYKTSPPASLFQLPPGARVITLKAGQV